MRRAQSPVPERTELAAVPLFHATDGDGPAGSGAWSRGSGRDLRVVPPAVAGSRFVAGEAAPAAELDWDEVARLRAEVARVLVDRGGAVGELVEASRRELGKAVILETIQLAAVRRFGLLGHTWSLAEQTALAGAVFDLMFGLGRLQPLLEREDVEDIMVFGHDWVFLNLTDGRKVPAGSVARSDEELVQLLQDFAAAATPPRPFSEAHPELNLNLAGARLAATFSITARPSIVIRRHRLVDLDLEDLVGAGTVTPVMASFLAAAVRARRSIVVAGEQGFGKTTMLRALCSAIGPEEVIGTFETERELGLETMPERHPLVFSFEARAGSGEIGANGRPAGEFTLERQLWMGHRFVLSRIIVGEVRGPEIDEMIVSMEAGTGSMSTTHAASASLVMDRLASCAMKTGRADRDAAIIKLSRCIDLIVQMRVDLVADQRGQPRKRRVVDEILAVTPGEDGLGYATTTVFRRVPQRPAVAHLLPDHLQSLAGFGFRVQDFHVEARQESSVTG